MKQTTLILNNKIELKIESGTISCFGNVVLILKANVSLNLVLGGDASLQAKTPVAQHCRLTNYQNRDNCATLLQRYLSTISGHGMSNEN